MKKYLFLFSIIICIILYFLVDGRSPGNKIVKLGVAQATLGNNENQCLDKSYGQITDSMVTSWESIFKKTGIQNNSFAMTLFFIEFFYDMEQEDTKDCSSLNEILTNKRTNTRSAAIATCAIMHKLGWDLQCFYNEQECYLGINFAEDWDIRKGNWVEKNGKDYYLKEFDNYTPVGELKHDNPSSTYQSLRTKIADLKPLPLINSLPKCSDASYHKKLKWWYKNKGYQITVFIPEEQAEWTENLPPSLFGMVASGILEMHNIGMVDKLRFLVDEFEEYDRVNFLYKLCQSENIFVYDNKQPIKSISRQLIEGSNDCDGRSIFLYCLLRTVLEYSDTEIAFVSWPNHLALGLKPRTRQAEDILQQKDGVCVGDKYYILDPAYLGDTHWGNKIGKLQDRGQILTP